MSMPLKNMIIAIIMLLIGGGYLYLSSQLPDRFIQNVPGPAFFPTIVAGFVILLALALLAKSLIGLQSKSLFEHELIFPGPAMAILLGFILFLLLLPYAGFIFAGIPFFAGLMMLCDRRKPLYIVAGSILIPVFLYYLFREGFNILLPAGQWM